MERRLLSWSLARPRPHQPGSKRGHVNINAQRGVPAAPPALTGPWPKSSESPGEDVTCAQVHRGSSSSSSHDVPPHFPWPCCPLAANVSLGHCLAPSCCAGEAGGWFSAYSVVPPHLGPSASHRLSKHISLRVHP